MATGDKCCSAALRVVSFLLVTQGPDGSSDCQAPFSKRHVRQGRLSGMDALQQGRGRARCLPRWGSFDLQNLVDFSTDHLGYLFSLPTL